MKKALLVTGIVVIFTACQQGPKKSSFNDPLVLSGEYDELKIAFNPVDNQVTGYFESSTGEDAASGSPQFSCIFYIEGKLTDKQAKIKSFSPSDNFPADNNDLIAGTLTPTSNNKLSLKLDEEHGGCTMVQHFKNEPVTFVISKKQNWIAIKYVTATKAFFYADARLETKRKSYLVKGNIIYIDEEKNNLVHCTFTDVNNHSTQGWIRSEDINRLE